MYCKKSNLTIYFTILLIQFLASCEPILNKSKHNNVSAAGLIGPTFSAKKDFLATVYINSKCTGSKISEFKFLIAAHCVLNKQTARHKSNLLEGLSINLVNSTATLKRTIKNVSVHPSYIRELKRRILNEESRKAISFKAFDIAIIEIREKSASIPIAQINYDTVEIGEEVILTGFGCEDSLNSTKKYPESLLLAKSIVVSTEDHDFYYKRDLSDLVNFNLATAGFSYHSSFASICPGDSGGPLYKKSDNSIIGINAQYLFKDKMGISFLNIHTSIHKSSEWIREQLEGAVLD